MTNQPVIETPRQVDARLRADRIRVGSVADLITGFEARDWWYAGFNSWNHYLKADVRIPRPERQRLVGHLHGTGMSTRRIASVVGVNRETVMRDLRSNQPANQKDA